MELALTYPSLLKTSTKFELRSQLNFPGMFIYFA